MDEQKDPKAKKQTKLEGAMKRRETMAKALAAAVVRLTPARQRRLRVRTLLVASVLPFVLVSAAAFAQTIGTLVPTSDLTLTQDHYGTILIGADGITLDCDNHLVVGGGIVLGRSYVTIRNCQVTGFTYGIALAATATDNTVESNTAFGNYIGFLMEGFSVYTPNRNTFRYNTADSNAFGGFHVVGSQNTTLLGNSAASNGAYGFFLSGLSGALVQGNRATGNSNGFFLQTSTGAVFIDNTATGSDNRAFGIHASASGITMTGNTASESLAGFFLSSDDNTLSGNTASNDSYGFLIAGRGNRLTLNAARGNGSGAQLFHGSAENAITDNALVGNVAGVSLCASDMPNHNRFAPNDDQGNQFNVRVDPNC